MPDKEKIYEPARHNENSPAPGMAAVNTHMPEETPLEQTGGNTGIGNHAPSESATREEKKSVKE